MRPTFWLLCPLGLLTRADSPATPSHGLTVKTTSGTYTGFVNASTPDVNVWLGLPYGVPPTGTRRFMPPEKALDYGSANATAYKPICIQDSGNHTGVFWELVPEFQNVDPQSEDCLYANVWAPRKKAANELLPVIIWVCGGGFKEGGGHAPYQVPDQWIQRTQTHLVVTFNYRLSVFGFPGAKGAINNVGLMDIRLMVEWLRDNVKGFGGDPERMILWGQSAGATAVDSYAYANPEDPIVSGFIASSGTAGPIANTSNNDAFTSLAGKVGCGNLTTQAELSCMQKVDSLTIQKIVQGGNNTLFSRGFNVIVDNITIFANNTERLERGLVAKRPMITGFTDNEGAVFGPFKMTDTAPETTNVTASSQRLACGVEKEVLARYQHNLTTYFYVFAGNFSNITPRPWLGAMHSSDLPVVFGTHYQFRGNSTELEWQTSYAMEAFWVSFARNSSADPVDHTGAVWPKYKAPNGQAVVFGNATVNRAVSSGSGAGADAINGCNVAGF